MSLESKHVFKYEALYPVTMCVCSLFTWYVFRDVFNLDESVNGFGECEKKLDLMISLDVNKAVTHSEHDVALT